MQIDKTRQPNVVAWLLPRQLDWICRATNEPTQDYLRATTFCGGSRRSAVLQVVLHPVAQVLPKLALGLTPSGKIFAHLLAESRPLLIGRILDLLRQELLLREKCFPVLLEFIHQRFDVLRQLGPIWPSR